MKEGQLFMNQRLQVLKVSENKRFLMTEEGTPFFWLADTAWEMLNKLTREDADFYLKNRTERGFTVIKVMILGEFIDGYDVLAQGNAYGIGPLLKNESGAYDPAFPNLEKDQDGFSYWDHIEYVVDRAHDYGLYVALFPAWGNRFVENPDPGFPPVIFNRKNAKPYGKWVAERFGSKNNVIWCVNGDRPLKTAEHFAVVNGMAEGIKEATGGRHLVAFHPYGEFSSSYHVHHEDWLDFHMIQSGHNHRDYPSYKMITADYGLLPVRPVVDGEARYEDHPINFNAENGYFDDADVRKAAYWSVFAGGFGFTYGHHCMWHVNTEPSDYFIMHWKDAAVRPGGSQMQYLRNLMESRPFFDRIPDQELIAENYPGANHIQATRGKDYAFLYASNGLKIKVKMGLISGSNVKAYWYEAKTGKCSFIGAFENKGVEVFTPPCSGRGYDWVLVLDDASRSFPEPGVSLVRNR